MRKRFVFILVLAFLVSLSLVVAEDNNSNNNQIYAKGQIIVTFEDNITQEEANLLIESNNLSWKSGYPKFNPESSFNWGVVNVPVGEEQKWINILKDELIVKSAEYDFIVSANNNEADSDDDCDDYRYSTCPDTCLKKCVSSGSNGSTSTSDCEGEGSCYSLDDNETEDNDDDENETEIEEDCWQCSKWSDCVNNTKTRICAQIANCTETTDCDDEDCENEAPKTAKKCGLGKKIKDYYINNECPEECTCTGSVIKCELASGRIMTIYAGKSGNIIVQIKGINMSTSVNLYKDENGTLTGVFNNKTKIIKILPDEARDKIKERIKSIIEDEEINLDDYGFYKIKAHKKARFLFLIPVRENIEGQVDSETGDIIIIRKGSWWGFLARDVKE